VPWSVYHLQQSPVGIPASESQSKRGLMALGRCIIILIKSPLLLSLRLISYPPSTLTSSSQPLRPFKYLNKTRYTHPSQEILYPLFIPPYIQTWNINTPCHPYNIRLTSFQSFLKTSIVCLNTLLILLLRLL